MRWMTTGEKDLDEGFEAREDPVGTREGTMNLGALVVVGEEEAGMMRETRGAFVMMTITIIGKTLGRTRREVARRKRMFIIERTDGLKEKRDEA